MANPILKIAIATPLRRCFDYLSQDATTAVGARVHVKFGARDQIGIVTQITDNTDQPITKLKTITHAIDQHNIFGDEIFDLCLWASQYYQHPIGEVLSAALPKLLREGQAEQLTQQRYWRLTPVGEQTAFLKSAKLQSALKLFQKQPVIAHSLLTMQSISSGTLRSLNDKNLIEDFYCDNIPATRTATSAQLALNDDQQSALSQILNHLHHYKTFLLDGVTGSGKTEVYLQAIAAVLDQGRQCLVLVPEIGLTPQTILRFSQRFSVPIVALHSALSDRERLDAWLLAKRGIAKIVIGTRSAIFSAFENLGLIVIDEEHDASFKQQDNFRYSARDLAIMRAHKSDIPIVLGSATPSLESLHNANAQRYQLLQLRERAGAAVMPRYHIVDMRNLAIEEMLSPTLTHAIERHLQANNQVLLFLNRRGFAPVMMCNHCGWVADCHSCEAHLTVHFHNQRLQCHHCGQSERIKRNCPKCGSNSLFTLGSGTEKIEALLKDRFTDVPVIRIDRDTTSGKRALQNKLDEIEQQNKAILIGTQMLAKGHHFPRVTCVGVLAIDNGLLSSDFRAPERTGQLLLQVAGRAGRENLAGEVFIQTRQPNNPLLLSLLEKGYGAFAQTLLNERKSSVLPPFSHLALFQTQAPARDQANRWLEQVKEILALNSAGVSLLGPIACAHEKRAGHYRYVLLLQAENRTALQEMLSRHLPSIERLTKPSALRWSLTIDPLEVT